MPPLLADSTVHTSNSDGNGLNHTLQLSAESSVLPSIKQADDLEYLLDALGDVQTGLGKIDIPTRSDRATGLTERLTSLFASLTAELWIACDEAESLVGSQTTCRDDSNAETQHYRRRISTGVKALVQSRKAELLDLIDDCEKFGDVSTFLEAQEQCDLSLLTAGSPYRDIEVLVIAAKIIELDKQFQRRSHNTIIALGLDPDLCRIPSLLHRLAAKNRAQLIQIVYEAGIPSCALDYLDRACLHVAAEFNSVDAAITLLRCGVDLDNTDMILERTALMIAAESGFHDLSDWLLKYGAAVEAKDATGKTALHLAALEGHKGVVQLLVDNRANVMAMDKDNNTALHLVAKINHLEVARFLLESGNDLGAKNVAQETALHCAIEGGDQGMANLLLAHGADIGMTDGEGKTALHMAAWMCIDKLVQLLIEKGANIKAKDHSGRTALHLAVISGSESTIRLLLEKSVDVNAKDVNGEPPLHNADDPSVAELLIRGGADINAADVFGETVLHRAVGDENRRMVEFLIREGAEVNLRENKGDTVLHLAVFNKDEEIIKLLLQKGCDLDVRNKQRLTPLDKAVKHQRREAAKLLAEERRRRLNIVR